ncbi:hypothetical protein FRB99_003268 [Tulasnella sp. 403]|nr:hypothetical protein FRB99_003268 [Tulasnella sp. 403]
MAVPETLKQRLKTRYPKPEINPHWLEECYTWLLGEYNLQEEQVDDILREIETQLLQVGTTTHFSKALPSLITSKSDLEASTLPYTGLPRDVTQTQNARIASGRGGPILCQVVSMTEIGHSAFSLQNVRQTRIDREDLAGLVEAGVEDEEENQPIPKYPRSTLKFELSDGWVTLPAIEYKKLPGLELGVTPLGSKMSLRNVLVRNGIAFLEPTTVRIHGESSVEEKDVDRDFNFLCSLRRRLGQPDPEREGHVDPPQPEAAQDLPAAVLQQQQTQATRVANDSSDYSEFGDDFDEEAFRQLDAIEEQHISASQTQVEEPYPPGGPTATVRTRPSITRVDSFSDVEMEIAEPPRIRIAAPRRPQRANNTQHEVIELSD